MRHRKKNGRFFRSKTNTDSNELSSCVNGTATVHCTISNTDSHDENDSPTEPTESKDETTDMEWRHGRRVVDLAVMAEALSQCLDCGQPLHLSHCQGEIRYGLGSILLVECQNKECEAMNDIPTGNRHQYGNRGPQTWDINTKAASGMLDAGIGQSQLNTLLAAMNLPLLSKRTVKRREREVGNKIVEFANKACDDALKTELSMLASDSDRVDSSMQGTSSSDTSAIVSDMQESANTSNGDISVSFDGGWQRRSTGRAYNSLSGHGVLIGKESGKIVKYAVRSKTCRTCEKAKQLGKIPKVHSCCRNWSGSAKAMEPDMAVSMLKSLKESGTTVKALIMDNDATTFARATAEVNSEMIKISDKNHTTKGFVSELYKIQGTDKGMTYNVIKYLKTLFAVAVSQNENKPDIIKSRLQAIPCHVYGNHEKCDSVWCKALTLSDPSTYKFKGLPYRRSLTSTSLQVHITVLFDKYADRSRELATLGSSQANESLNQAICRKAPKSQHYSGSDSLLFRVGAAVAEKNTGSSYSAEVYKELGLSPGIYNKKLAFRKDKSRAKQRLFTRTHAFKKRRKELREQRRAVTAASEVREGPTYSSDIATEASVNLDAIPAAFPPPDSTPLTGNCKHIFFDLETTGLERTSDITQIAAVVGNNTFNQYILPSQEISRKAAEATGMSCDGQFLYVNGTRVHSVSTKDAICSFLDFLKHHGPCVLVAHNGHSFDSHILMHHIVNCELVCMFENCCQGFADSKIAFRQKHVDRVKAKGSFSQIALCCDLLHLQYSAHDALEDVKALQKLCQNCLEPSVLMQTSKSSDSSLKHYEQNKRICLHKGSFENMIKSKAISSQMASKCAGSGLSQQHIKLAYLRSGFLGVKNVLGENVGGKPRVTKKLSIVEKITDFLALHV